MKSPLKIVALLAALTLAMQPLASCFSEDLTRSEEECCLEMAGHCGQVSMPTSHTCCKYVDYFDSARPEAKKPEVSNDFQAVVPAPTQDLIPALPPILMALVASTESPPGSPAASLQILRI